MTVSDWPTEAIAGCLAPLSLGHLPKLQTKHYGLQGKYPIIDQGRELVAGWTDDSTGLIYEALPVVVFGDHTRALKYVDFPFVRGADGTQILKPRVGIDPLYFYYACRAAQIPSRGYNRHYTALKESEVVLPPKGEQIAIGKVLNLIEGCCNLQQKQHKMAEALKTAAMQALFTRGLRGEAQKETEIGLVPESWSQHTVADLCHIWSGGTPPKSVAQLWGGDIPWVSGKDLKTPALDDAIDHITHEGIEAASRLAPAGSVLLLVRGMGLAKDLPIAVINRPMAFNQDVKALLPRGRYSGQFLRSAIYVGKERLLAKIVPSAHGTMTLNLDDVETFKLACPTDISEATEIVATLDSIDRKIDLHRRKRAVLDDLFKALLHKLMTGEIRTNQLDLSALSLGAQADVAA